MQNKPEFRKLLEYINQFVALSAIEEEILSQHVTFRNYLKKQYVLQQGDICTHESFVIKGCLNTFFVNERGEQFVGSFAIENWWVVDLESFINRKPADFAIQCLENSTLAQISYKDSQLLYQKIPKLERFFRMMLQQAFCFSQKRIVYNFSKSAKDRYIDFKKQFPAIEQRVPQYLIASYLGFSREFLSKIKAQLASN
jgi:CRP-like cAMP-binding protein